MRTIDNNILLGETCRQLASGKKVKLRAKGNSMRPFILGEDILVIVPTNVPRKGDVVLAHIEGKRYVVHRIIRINDERITLMGDANLYETEECTRTDIFGTVETLIRNEKEININSRSSLLFTTVWRTILPLRRLKERISSNLNILSLC